MVSLEADGSAMYTLQALWTMAREGLDVTTIILANRAYAILNMELSRVGAAGADGVGPAAAAMLDISRPELDFVALAGGMGVRATRVETADDLVKALDRCLRRTRAPPDRGRPPPDALTPMDLTLMDPTR